MNGNFIILNLVVCGCCVIVGFVNWNSVGMLTANGGSGLLSSAAGGGAGGTFIRETYRFVLDHCVILT